MYKLIGPIHIDYRNGKVSFKNVDLRPFIPLPKDPQGIVLSYCEPIYDPDGLITFLDGTNIRISKQNITMTQEFLSVYNNGVRMMNVAQSYPGTIGSLIDVYKSGWWVNTTHIVDLFDLDFKILWMDDKDMMIRFIGGRMFYIGQGYVDEI